MRFIIFRLLINAILISLMKQFITGTVLTLQGKNSSIRIENCILSCSSKTETKEDIGELSDGLKSINKGLEQVKSDIDSIHKEIHLKRRESASKWMSNNCRVDSINYAYYTSPDFVHYHAGEKAEYKFCILLLYAYMNKGFKTDYDKLNNTYGINYKRRTKRNENAYSLYRKWPSKKTFLSIKCYELSNLPETAIVRDYTEGEQLQFRYMSDELGYRIPHIANICGKAESIGVNYTINVEGW